MGVFFKNRWTKSDGSPFPAPFIVPAVLDPIADWKMRHTPDAMVCCRPWVSFGTATAVTVSWLPPLQAGRFPTVRYELQIRVRVDDGMDQMAAALGPWTECAMPHASTTPSHIVSDLPCGAWVEFRVRMRAPLVAGGIHGFGHRDDDEGGGGSANMNAGDGGSSSLDCGKDLDHLRSHKTLCWHDMPFSDVSVPFRVGYADTMAVVPPLEERRAGVPLMPPSDFTPHEMRWVKNLCAFSCPTYAMQRCSLGDVTSATFHTPLNQIVFFL